MLDTSNPDETADQRQKRVTALIIKRRKTLPFMVVARAVVSQLHAKSPKKTIAACNAFGISKQTRRNWLSGDAEGWIKEWENYFSALSLRSPVPLRRRDRIADADLQWMKSILAKVRYGTFRSRLDEIRYEAGKDPKHSHLRKISLSTLWRRREELWIVEEHEAKSIIRPQPVPRLTGTEKASPSRTAIKRRSPGNAGRGMPPVSVELELEPDGNPF